MNGISVSMAFGSLPQATEVAGQVDALAFSLMALNVLLVAVLFGLIASFAYRYRRGSSADRSGKVSERKLETGWTLGLLALFLAIFVWSARLYIAEESSPERSVLNIHGLGKQWMWKFEHPGGQREINQLHLPLGVPVKLLLVTQDVIHSFYVPAFRLKQDVVPGRVLAVSFTPSRPGHYRLFCAEYCGLDHARMMGEVVVLEQEDYLAWLSSGMRAEARP